MRQGPNNNNKRGRSRSGNPQHGGGNGGGNNGGNRRPHTPNRNQSFDSNGPDVRIRGSAYQVFEKYLNLARDATAAGDRIMAESYYQHAEHYYRVINVMEYGPDDQRRPRSDSYNNQGQQQYNGDQFGEQSDQQGGDEPQGPDGQNERPRDDRQRDERPRDDRQRDDGQRDDRHRNDRNRNDRHQNDQGHGDQNQGNDQPFGPEQPYSRAPRFTGDEPQPYPQTPEHEQKTGPLPREELSDSGNEEEFDEAGQPE